MWRTPDESTAKAGRSACPVVQVSLLRRSRPPPVRAPLMINLPWPRLVIFIDNLDVLGLVDGDSRISGPGRAPGEPFGCPVGSAIRALLIINLPVPRSVIIADHMEIIRRIDDNGRVIGIARGPSEPLLAVQSARAA